LTRTIWLVGLVLAVGCRTSPAPVQDAAAVASPAAAAVLFQATPVAPDTGNLVLTGLGSSETMIIGRVARYAMRSRVSGATLQVRSAGVSAPIRMDGYFVLFDVPPGSHLIEVEHPQYGKATALLQVGPPGRLVGQQAGPGGRLVGRTRSSTGAPWSDVQVITEWGGLARGAQSRVDGSFLIENVPPGVYQLRAERAGLYTVIKEVMVSDSVQTEVFFDLERTPPLLPRPPG
jgi:hypothetical protein